MISKFPHAAVPKDAGDAKPSTKKSTTPQPRSATLNPPTHAKFQVAVLGLGYVGIPLAIGFAKAGCKCLGYDKDAERVEVLTRGDSPFAHISAADITELTEMGMLEFTTDANRLTESEAILVSVPTPLRQHHDPDLSHILDAGREVASRLRPGMLICLESSTYPGTTRNEFREVLERGSGLVAGKEFHLAFSPEREDPGNPESQLRKIPKVIGGLTKGCLERASKLYSKAIDTIVPVSSCDTAEAVKLTENIFRYVNIGLVNELKTIYAALGIDIWEVQAAAKTKPFGFMPFYPGVGVGGHCIPVDPWYLTWRASELDLNCRFIELAGNVNHSMPGYVVNQVVDALNHEGRSLHGSHVLVLGLAYKPGVADDRESQSYTVMDLLAKKDALVDYYDPHLPWIPPNRGIWSGRRSIHWSPEALSRYSAAIVCTAHPEVDYEMLAESVPVVVDACNIVPRSDPSRVVTA